MRFIFLFTSGADFHVNGGISFILEKTTGNRVYPRLIDSDQCALTLVSSRRLGGALCVEKWTCLEPLSFSFLILEGATWTTVFFAGKLDLLWLPGNIFIFFSLSLAYFARRSDAESNVG